MPVELHDQQLKQLENRFLECFQEHDMASRSEESMKNKRTLPVKALNEVLDKWTIVFTVVLNIFP